MGRRIASIRMNAKVIKWRQRPTSSLSSGIMSHGAYMHEHLRVGASTGEMTGSCAWQRWVHDACILSIHTPHSTPSTPLDAIFLKRKMASKGLNLGTSGGVRQRRRRRAPTKNSTSICTARYRGIQMKPISHFEFVSRDTEEFAFPDLDWWT